MYLSLRGLKPLRMYVENILIINDNDEEEELQCQFAMIIPSGGEIKSDNLEWSDVVLAHGVLIHKAAEMAAHIYRLHNELPQEPVKVVGFGYVFFEKIGWFQAMADNFYQSRHTGFKDGETVRKKIWQHKLDNP